jgi:hypothetical protein
MERQSKVAAVTDKAASDNNDEKGFPKTDFPWFMHNFVNEASKEYPEIVSWSSNGAYFKIQHDDKEKLQDILTQYFQRTYMRGWLFGCPRWNVSDSSEQCTVSPCFYCHGKTHSPLSTLFF